MRILVLVVVAALALSPLPASANEQVIRLEFDELVGPSVQPTSINNRGTIVGSMSPGGGRPAVPFRWTESGGVEFFLGDSPGQANDVNDAGAIVGYLELAGEAFAGFLWTPQDGLVDLGSSFVPSAINNRGQIVGTVVGQFGATGPYLWENGVLTELGGDAAYGIASDINERGQVVGQVLQSAFRWSVRAGLTPLTSAAAGPNAVSAAFAVNNSGEIVGFDSGDGVETYPVRWTRTRETIAFQLNRGTFVAVNDSGMAVGRYPVNSEWNAFASTRSGELIQLGVGIPVAVNNRGAIVGTASVNGENRVVVWLVRN